VGGPGTLQGRLEITKGNGNGEKNKLELRLHSRTSALARLYYNPDLPSLEDYYEPFTFRYNDLFDCAGRDDQPTAIPVSMVTGEPLHIESGPNWDDDLGGSNAVCAATIPTARTCPMKCKAALDEVERVVFNYMPRICNHCLNPACVAACPSGAIYKRAEDGIVLVNENQCRAWRMCVAACPYKKVLLQLEHGQVREMHPVLPAHGDGPGPRLRAFLCGPHPLHGRAAVRRRPHPRRRQCPDEELVDSFLDTILDPFDPKVIAAAKANDIDDGWIKAAQESPVYKFAKVWKIALPLHLEYRTMAMMFYIPPLSPVMSSMQDGSVRLDI
jgi:nitrate reductase / nitrite oxidoreductase, beta subunit